MTFESAPTCQRVKEREEEKKEEDDDKKNVCYKSLFYWRQRIEKVSTLPPHLGIFMYLKTALGLRKNRALYLCFLLYLLYQLALVAKASGDHLQNRQEAIQKNDLLDIVFDVSCL
jgi:hypothetical protein